jgi:predicted RNase H-like nuclease (RuvC/YqgF family)
VADEFEVAEEIFEQPPNIFDRFKLHEIVALNRENENLAQDLADEKAERYRLAKGVEQLRQDIIAYSRELRAAHLESEENYKLRQRLENLQGRLLQAETAHHAVLSSTSWRISRPVRVIGRLRERLRQRFVR